MRARVMALASLLFSLWIGGCEAEKPKPPEKGRSLAELIEKTAPDAEARLKGIKKLKSKLDSAKPTEKPPSGIEFFLPGSELKSSANAVLLYDDELSGEKTKHLAAIYTGDAISQCRHLVKLADDPDPEHETIEATGISRTNYQVCADLKYAVVIHVTNEQKPVVGERDETTQTIPFTPGVVEADVLVFELPSGKLKGGVSVRATNQESMTMDKHTNTLEDDLRHALYSEIVKHVPVPETKTKKYLQ